MSYNIQDKIINHLVVYYLLVEVFDKFFIDTKCRFKRKMKCYMILI